MSIAAIQTAERFNDRGHILYAAVRLPHSAPQEAVNLPSTRFEVISSGRGRYRRPDGSIGEQMIVQLKDITDEKGL
ncbi:hypothetical protein W59_25576 [Rhodococcus opacus RKJ300 = JCM 13270]|uniref:Uncharacterized protein n=1 Tax=Rhodococcus opacus RKJ300 = JCM 13270 TaxID=1165867 RepID=I0WKP2_RHOOP|nr:hypothetical protein W59_25576 [Rhodococcus opacus RKJ300 = JCM 13270]